jgi:hypothetical protein
VAGLTNGAAADYVRFCASTVGYTAISVSFVAASSTSLSASQVVLQYCADGATFAAFTSAAISTTPVMSAQSPILVGASVTDNVAGFCFQFVMLAAAPTGPTTLTLDDVQVSASTCAPGYFNNGTGVCVVCPGGALCSGGTVAGATLPSYVPTCGAPCTAGCVLTAGSFCAGSLCTSNRTAPPAGFYTSAGDSCSTSGSVGAVVAKWTFDTGSTVATSGFPGLASSGRATVFTSAPGSFFSGSLGWRASGVLNAPATDYLRFCTSTAGYTTISVAFVLASSALA